MIFAKTMASFQSPILVCLGSIISFYLNSTHNHNRMNHKSIKNGDAFQWVEIWLCMSWPAELQKLRWFSFSVDWDLGGLSQLAIAEVLCKLQQPWQTWNKIWFWVHRSNFIIAQRNLHGNTPQGSAIFVIWVLCVRFSPCYHRNVTINCW